MGQVMNVEGCTALVTGANRGLGRALAGMLAAPESIEREMQAEWRKSLTASGNAP